MTIRLIVNWLIYTAAILIAAYILPGVHVNGFLTALVLAVVLGLINTFLRPVLFVLTLPLTIVTFGFFVLILNAFLVLLAAAIVPGFAVAGFWWAFIFSVVLWLVQGVLKSLEK